MNIVQEAVSVPGAFFRELKSNSFRNLQKLFRHINSCSKVKISR